MFVVPSVFLVAAWSLFGRSEPPAPATPPDTEKIVKAAVEKAVADVSARIVRETADAKADAEKAEKLRVEAREDAERIRLEAREDAKAKAEKAEKLRIEAREDEKTEKTERDERERQLDARVFRLYHASAAEVAEKINAVWNGDFGQSWKVAKAAVAFPESNSLVITAPRAILDACEKAVAALDVAPQQVYIEARFVELANNASHKLGIDWSMLDGMSGSLSLDAGWNERKMEGVSKYNSKDNSYELSSGVKGGMQSANISHINGTVGMSDLYVILHALEKSDDARTFSNPKIIVSSGKRATVDMTTKYPNVKISAKRTVNGDNTSVDLDMQMAPIPGEDKLMFANESFFSWGISLNVTPRISTNGLINVQIVPTISSQRDWVEAGTASDAKSETISARYPVLDVQRLVTEFNMASGTTAVIGGLSRTVESQIDSGIPWLRDWWWIGPRLFGSKQRVKEQKEIIVFVTVGLVDPNNIEKDAGLPKNAVLGRQYTEDLRREPGDRRLSRPEGMQSLDLRSLEEQYRDPRRTNRVSSLSLDDYIPFQKDPHYKRRSR